MPAVARKTTLNTILLNRQGRGSLQQQLSNNLRSVILNGQLRAGEKLPSTRSFMQDLGVSRNTVRLAYDQLIAEGYLKGRNGSGTYVARDLPEKTSHPVGIQQSALLPPPKKAATFSRRGKAIAAEDVSMGYDTARAFAPSLPAIDLFPVKTWNKIQAR